ncbi:MAG: ABC transporter ATP-binding protein [Gemmataceae bacterium]
MTTTNAVEFDAVSKAYPAGWLRRAMMPAVVDVTLAIPAGEVVGLIGPNRAGKTTLVKLLLGLCRPTAGRIVRLGQPVSVRSTLARVGYVHESHAFPPYLSAAEVLGLYAAFGLVPADEARRRIPRLLEWAGLADRAAEPIGRFSKGMRQRLGLAQAVLGEPDLLVLDEPGEGLDLAGRRLVAEAVAAVKARGGTVLLVSHQLTEVERLCDRLVVVRGGRLHYAGTLAEVCRDPISGAIRPLADVVARLYEGANDANAVAAVVDPVAGARHVPPGGGVAAVRGDDGGHTAGSAVLPERRP